MTLRDRRIHEAIAPCAISEQRDLNIKARDHLPIHHNGGIGVERNFLRIEGRRRADNIIAKVPDWAQV